MWLGWFVVRPVVRGALSRRGGAHEGYAIMIGEGGGLRVTAKRLQLLLDTWDVSSPRKKARHTAHIEGWSLQWTDEGVVGQSRVEVRIAAGGLCPPDALVPYAKAAYDALSRPIGDHAAAVDMLVFWLDGTLDEAADAVKAAIRTAAFLEHVAGEPSVQLERALGLPFADVALLRTQLEAADDRGALLSVVAAHGTPELCAHAVPYADRDALRVGLLANAVRDIPGEAAEGVFDALLALASEPAEFDVRGALVTAAMRADSTWAARAVATLLARYDGAAAQLLAELSSAASTDAVREALSPYAARFEGGLALAAGPRGELSVAGEADAGGLSHTE